MNAQTFVLQTRIEIIITYRDYVLAMLLILMMELKYVLFAIILVLNAQEEIHTINVQAIAHIILIEFLLIFQGYAHAQINFMITELKYVFLVIILAKLALVEILLINALILALLIQIEQLLTIQEYALAILIIMITELQYVHLAIILVQNVTDF